MGSERKCTEKRGLLKEGGNAPFPPKTGSRCGKTWLHGDTLKLAIYLGGKKKKIEGRGGNIMPSEDLSAHITAAPICTGEGYKRSRNAGKEEKLSAGEQGFKKEKGSPCEDTTRQRPQRLHHLIKKRERGYLNWESEEGRVCQKRRDWSKRRRNCLSPFSGGSDTRRKQVIQRGET